MLNNNVETCPNTEYSVCDYLFETCNRYDLHRLEQLESNFVGKKMNSECRLAINIPVDYKERRIERTLLQYSNQNIDNNLVDTTLLINAPDGENIQEYQAFKDTVAFIEKYPYFPVNYTTLNYQANARRIGRIRKDLANITLLRAVYQNIDLNNLVLVTNDADAVSLDPTYLSRIYNNFINTPTLGGLTGLVEYPFEDLSANHVFLTLQRFEQFKEIYSRYKKDNIVMRGGNTAFRATQYMNAGGHTRDRVGENRRIHNYLVNNGIPIKYDPKVKIVTSPRRQLTALERDVPQSYRYRKFGQEGDLSEDYLIGKHRLLLPEFSMKVTHPYFVEYLQTELEFEFIKEIIGALNLDINLEEIETIEDLKNSLYELISLNKVNVDIQNIINQIKQKYIRVGFFTGIKLQFDNQNNIIIEDISTLVNGAIQKYSNY